MYRTICCILLAVGLAGCCKATSSGSGGSTSSPEPQITMEKFAYIKPGMSYEVVAAVLGSPGVEMSSSKIMGVTTVMYDWQNGGFMAGGMNATFQNNKLVSKAQFGLK